jgi:hypothetical protein
MNDIEILEEFINKQKSNKGTFVATDFEITAIENLIQENKELKERINKSLDFINDDDTFFNDGESWQNVLHIERILKGE